jgi:hypothetical protein
MNPVTWLGNAVTLFVACLHEIFDESAYVRFLRQHRMPSSRRAYTEFCREQSATKARRPRCC